MIIISPYAQKLRNGKENPKNFPYWEEVISGIDEHIVQIGVEGEKQIVPDFRKNLSFEDLSVLLSECITWIGVDSFFQHFAWYNKKPGVVIWGASDPLIFGHKENTNLLLDRKYLRNNQFDIWETMEYTPEVFVTAETVLANLLRYY